MIPVRWVCVCEYYDKPLTGWLRAQGKYLYFVTDDYYGDEEGTEYKVYDMPRELRLVHLRHHRQFRNIVGWHHEFAPDGRRGEGPFPGWRRYYNIEKPKPFDPRAVGTLIGTTDLRVLTRI